MKRNLIGVLSVAGGLLLWGSVAGFAQTSPTDTAKQAIAACTPTLTTPSGLAGEALKEAAAANLEATTAIAQVVGQANFKVEELAAEGTDTEEGQDTSASELTTELNALVTETCQALAEIRTEYNATMAELQSPVAATPEQDRPEVKPAAQTKPAAEKPEVEKPEVEKPDVEKPEVQKPEGVKQETSDHNNND
jgi:hypothetical protein